MSEPQNPFPVVKTHWRVGDQRTVPAAAVDALHGTEAYDSYSKLYHIDGRSWVLEGQVSQADGQTYYLLRCVGE